MSEEERLFAEVEKLEVNEGDVLLVKAGSLDRSVVEPLHGLAEKLSSAHGCLVILIGPDDCIANLDKEVMETYGWIRKERQ